MKTLSALCMLTGLTPGVYAFFSPHSSIVRHAHATSTTTTTATTTQLFVKRENYVKRENRDKKQEVTLRELMKEIENNPDQFIDQAAGKGSAKRTRKKTDNPKQQYVYAAQRRQQMSAPGGEGKKKKRDATDEEEDEEQPAAPVIDTFSPIYQARQLGMVNPASQHCDAAVAAMDPQILGRVQVGDDATKPSSFAYIIEKPAGWSILGGDKKKKVAAVQSDNSVGEDQPEQQENEVVETDMLALMTPEEIVEYKEQLKNPSAKVDTDDDPFDDDSTISMTVRDGEGQADTIAFDEQAMLAAMTPEEIADFEEEGGFVALGGDRPKKNKAETAKKPKVSKTATFEPYSRPSVVQWLKELKAEEGTPIRGGKYWTAVAGATNVDDSGLVVLCPKDKVDSIFIDYAKYVAVVGNGKYMAAKPKNLETIPKASTDMEVIAKLRRGRGEDVVVTVGLAIAEHFSTCSHAVQACQEQLMDGIRGDPAANPFDRRAPRRLVHCDAVSVSSLTIDDNVMVESEFLPDDISVLADRRNNHEFLDGSFLGRAELAENPYTNAFRELNGAADGFQGWTVDRYDEWLMVQHDDQYPRGPLPSIHDGATAGVYYLAADPNRSMMGRGEVRATLLEGKPAPELVPIQENGVTYLATLDKDLSTGIFLDQRLQRAWLTRNCNDKTRVLNCFAHCGAFSVAAAAAGASTVSLDLNKKFLDRIPPQLELNGIDFDDRHDSIFGDCFDWLARLSKRGEQFDIIILDPPSTSSGTKKKRWSVKNDMAELVALAAPMVKKGGLLWTTTNSATIHPIKFAKMCKKGLDDVGLNGAKLERVATMPSDFPSIGPQPVKNLVWRIP